MKRTRTVLGLTMAAAMIALTACGGGDDSSAGSDSTSQEQSAAADAPELEGIPDVVAEVNGEEVTKDEFAPIYQAQLEQATAQAEQAGGEKPDEAALQKQTVDNLVDTELLAQEAEARGLSVSEEAVDDELAAIAEQNQLGSTEELLTALEQQGTTEEQARAQLETQVMVRQLVEDEAGPAATSDQDLRALYRRAVQQQEQMGQQAGQQQEIPPFADVKAQLQEQAEAEHVGTVAGTLVEELRKDADITVNVGE